MDELVADQKLRQPLMLMLTFPLAISRLVTLGSFINIVADLLNRLLEHLIILLQAVDLLLHRDHRGRLLVKPVFLSLVDALETSDDLDLQL